MGQEVTGSRLSLPSALMIAQFLDCGLELLIRSFPCTYIPGTCKLYEQSWC